MLAAALVACDSGKEPGSPINSEKSAPLAPVSATEHETTLVAGCSGCHGSDGVTGTDFLLSICELEPLSESQAISAKDASIKRSMEREFFISDFFSQ